METQDLPLDILRKIFVFTVRTMTIDQRLATGIPPCRLRCPEQLVAALENRPPVVFGPYWATVALRHGDKLIFGMINMKGYDRLCTFAQGITGRCFFWY